MTAAESAAATGQVPTVSAWVNDAMRLKLERDRRLKALAALITDYEAEHGKITEQDMARAARQAKRRPASS